MPKVLAISGMVVAVLFLLIFGADLGIGIPFGGASGWMDISFLLAAAILGYLSWSTYREQV